MHSVTVVCIGNDLVADDGVGHVIYQRLLNTSLPSNTRVKFLGLGGMDLLDQIQGERLLIVVDAVQLGTAPGTVHVLGWDQLPDLQVRPVSGHGIGIREAIEVARRLYPEKVPQQINLVGVEGACFDQLGTGLTDVVAAAIDEAIAEVTALISSI